MTESPTLVDDYGHYIGGRWSEPDRGRYDDVDPATEEVIATAPDASTDQVGTAIDAARRAFDSGVWSGLPAEERARCLAQLGAALLDRADDFFALAQREWGCSANERMFHVEGPAVMLSRAGELAAEPVEQPIDAWGAGGTTLLRYEPLGVVSVLTPWNFPHTLNAMKLGSALAAGNSVVLKPSPLTPLAGLALARIIDEHTDIPPGVVNVITPSGLEASKLLTTDPRIDMVSFTGSSAVGREVMGGAAGSMKRILLECGGKSAAIFCDDLEVTDELLERVLFESLTMHAGQACILNSRLLLPDSMHDEVVDRMADLARNVKVGNTADTAVQMGPLISRAHLERVEGCVSRAVSDGATVVAGGARPEHLQHGFFYAPTVLVGVDSAARIAQDEVFGPVLTVLRYRDDDDAIRIANDTEYGLSGTIWSSDVERAIGIARRVRTGQIAINGTIAGDAPFGGFKQSGIGREGGLIGLHAYMEPKAIGVPA
jgi:acyl-CoA reductase-like NAD-dependent aldehyde dehydrogenase